MADHMGAVVHDLATWDLLTLNWGGRNASLWSLSLHDDPTDSQTVLAAREVLKNPSHYTDNYGIGHGHSGYQEPDGRGDRQWEDEVVFPPDERNSTLYVFEAGP